MEVKDRHICTEDDPWTPQMSERAIHPDAKLLYSEDGSLASGGSYDRYECPHCKLRFWVTIPD